MYRLQSLSVMTKLTVTRRVYSYHPNTEHPNTRNILEADFYRRGFRTAEMIEKRPKQIS